MDLYALDLSTVVNKYLGETEKNLDAVFSRAEELDVDRCCSTRATRC